MFKQGRSLCRLFLFNRIRFWPCLTSLVLIIVFLQVLHNALLSRLEEKEARIKENISISGRHLQGRMFHTVISEMEERVNNSHRFDRSGTYFILDNFLTSEHVILGHNEYGVSIVTQGSTSRLHHLVELTERWNGPVSVSVFTYDDEFISTVSSLVHFHFCNDHIYRHVSFHLIYPISRAPKHTHHFSDLKLLCHHHNLQIQKQIRQNSESQNYADTDLEHPTNLLRNVAINYVQTPYIFMIDIDFVPSADLRSGFQRFMSLNSNLVKNTSDINSDHYMSRQRSLSAFVVPAFEIQGSVAVPKHKADLLELWMNGVVRPFYSEVCVQCQRASRYDVWRGLDKGDAVSIGYTVDRESLWEPFYIAKTSLPLYDERFKQYGYNRISQICEMHVLGFTFYVLDNAFIVHKGFKSKGGFHANKDAENERNKHLFQKFEEELSMKYPQESRRC